MRKIKLVSVIAIFLVVALLPINAFGEEYLSVDIANKKMEITQEASIYELVTYLTNQAISIMENNKNDNEACELLDKLLIDYGIANEGMERKLLNVYSYYKEYFKEEFAEYPKECIEYNKEEEVFREISEAILDVSGEKIEAIALSKPNSEKTASVNEILVKYNLRNDLEAEEIIYNYNREDDEYDVHREISRIFRDYEQTQKEYYEIEKLANKIEGFKLEDEAINAINQYIKETGIEDVIQSKEILDAYNNPKKYGYDTSKEAIFRIIINAIKNDAAKDGIYDIYEHIIDDINDMKLTKISKHLYVFLKSYDIQLVIDEYDLIDIYCDHKKYGFNSGEEAVLKEGFKALDIFHSQESINNMVDKIINTVDVENQNVIVNIDLDTKLKEDINQEILDEVYYGILKDYDMIDAFDSEKIIKAYLNYEENGYDNYEDSVAAVLTGMFKNAKLKEEIKNIINSSNNTNDIEKIREEISDYIKESDFEKYIDYNAINQINNNVTMNHNDKVNDISDVMIKAIVDSNKKDIIKEIKRINDRFIENRRINDVSNILKEYNLESYVRPYEVLDLCEYYEEENYNNSKEALLGEIFNVFTKRLSQEEKNIIAKQAIDIIKDDKINDSDLKNLKKDFDFNMYYIMKKTTIEYHIPVKDILNIYYDCEAYGYSSIQEGIVNEIINVIVKEIRQDIIKAINSDYEQERIKRDIYRILKNNNLDGKIDYKRIIDVYNNYGKYGFSNSAQALEQELQNLFEFLK